MSQSAARSLVLELCLRLTSDEGVVSPGDAKSPDEDFTRFTQSSQQLHRGFLQLSSFMSALIVENNILGALPCPHPAQIHWNKLTVGPLRRYNAADGIS